MVDRIHDLLTPTGTLYESDFVGGCRASGLLRSMSVGLRIFPFVEPQAHYLALLITSAIKRTLCKCEITTFRFREPQAPAMHHLKNSHPMKLFEYVIAYPRRLFPKSGNPHRVLVLAYRWTRSGKLRGGVGYILFYSIPLHPITSNPVSECSSLAS